MPLTFSNQMVLVLAMVAGSSHWAMNRKSRVQSIPPVRTGLTMVRSDSPPALRAVNSWR